MTDSAVNAIEIVSRDGTILRGQRWAGSGAWVVLLHEPGDDWDLDRWQPLALFLAARDWTVLAVDLRGHGASAGEWDPGRAVEDLGAIVAFARAGGATFVAITGAGASAITALQSVAATRPGAMVLLSPTLRPGDDISTLRGAGEPKLVIAGSGDDAARANAEQLRKVAIGWGFLLRLPVAEQGTALLRGPAAAQVREHISGFLAEQRFLASRRPFASGPGGRVPPDPEATTGPDTEQRRSNE